MIFALWTWFLTSACLARLPVNCSTALPKVILQVYQCIRTDNTVYLSAELWVWWSQYLDTMNLEPCTRHSLQFLSACERGYRRRWKEVGKVAAKGYVATTCTQQCKSTEQKVMKAERSSCTGSGIKTQRSWQTKQAQMWWERSDNVTG